MVNDWVFRLECGDRYVNLLKDPTGGWGISENGVTISAPPSSVTYTGNTKFSGSKRASSYYQDTKITLQARLLNQSGRAILQKSIHDVTKFIIDVQSYQEGKTREPVYLVRRMAEGYTGTGRSVVLFGRGNIYHEVKSIDSIEIPPEAYSSVLTKASANIAMTTITMTCGPFGYSRPLPMGEATGYVRFNQDGDIDVWEATTNLFVNPSFENDSGSFYTGWTLSNLTALLDIDHIRYGFQSCRCTNTSGSGGTLYQALTLTNATVYTISAYCYTDGTDVTSDCQLYANGAAIATTYTADTKTGWYRLTGTVTGDGASKNHGVYVPNGSTVIVDAVQVEAKTFVTPFTVESSYLPLGAGIAYTGTSLASSSVRTAGQYRMMTNLGDGRFETLFYGKGAISFWVNTPWAGNDNKIHWFFDSGQATNNNAVRVYKDGSNNLTFVIYGAVAAGYKSIAYTVDGTSWKANTDNHVTVTWDSTGPLALYLNGSSVGSTGSSGTWASQSVFGSYFYVGSDLSAGNQVDGTIGDLRIFGQDATVTAVTLYAAGHGKSMLPYIWNATLYGRVDTVGGYFYIANVPGDAPARSQLMLSASGGAAVSTTYFGITPMKKFPHGLYYTSVCANITAGTPYVSFNYMKNARERYLLSGRYRLLMMYDYQVGACPNAWNINAFVDNSNFGNLYPVNQTTPAQIMDLGVFAVPPVKDAYPFFGTESPPTESLDSSMVYGTLNTAGACPVKVYGVYFINEQGGYGTATSYSRVFDTISNPPRSYTTGITGSAMALTSLAQSAWYGNIPYVNNGVWNVCTVVTQGSAGGEAGVVVPLGYYMANWMWSE